MIQNLFPVIVVALIVGTLIASMLLQWLWNITIPDVFKIRTITYWEAFRLILISALLFGGLGGGLDFVVNKN